MKIIFSNHIDRVGAVLKFVLHVGKLSEEVVKCQ
jgi:hypothetical protein